MPLSENRFPSLFRLVLVSGLSLLACDRPPQKHESETTAKVPELLEPVETEAGAERRCQNEKDRGRVTLRTPPGKGALEIGAVVSSGDLIAVSALLSGADSEAFVLLADGRGREKRVELGKVHGAVEPPLLTWAGDYLLVGLFDSDASGIQFRIARIRAQLDDPQVAFGPTLSMPRDDFPGATLAASKDEEGKLMGLVAWDETDKTSLRSRVVLLTFSVTDLKVLVRPRSISGPEEDAVSPLIVSGAERSWVTFLRYGEMERRGLTRGDSEPLVEEPPRSLWTSVLGSGGAPTEAALRLSDEGEDVVAFDGVSADTGLVVAYRTALTVGEEGGSPIRVKRAGLDGSLSEAVFAHDLLGPGAPALFGDPGGEAWLFARGQETQVLAASLPSPLALTPFASEAELSGGMPMARTGDRIVLLTPDSSDFRISAAKCEFSAPKEAEKPPG